ncbi:MAG: mycofactocin precursor [Deltaproteobacteria bacterium]|nr:mycofactocin precursor [Deltaproteobacteria bacterium]MBW2112484.1 mycofactocin precursor [Deltaproteobacteria bacterium]MBW2354368.1 mycofactocin precursor [Deltaproteobacteria bacterium]
MKGMEERETTVKENQDDDGQEDIFKTREIVIEEMAIDGICGVY